MINIVIWSKDRAAQLDLTLQTLKKYFVEWKGQSVSIICKYSNDFYKQGYAKVKALHPEFNFIEESNFRTDTLNAIFNTKKEYVAFLVDDDIFIDTLTLESPEFKEFDNNPLIATLSCRMAPYIDFCYTQNKPAKKPVLNEKRIWDWHSDCSGDWNYPWSVAAFHIFRKMDLVPLQNMNFRATNSFEGTFCNIPFSGRHQMICFEHAKAFTGANNRVQIENNNRTENTDPVDMLNRIFLAGKRLSDEANHYIISNACHGKVEYVWH